MQPVDEALPVLRDLGVDQTNNGCIDRDLAAELARTFQDLVRGISGEQTADAGRTSDGVEYTGVWKCGVRECESAGVQEC